MHPFVVSWAIKNLKYMHSARTVATASERAQKLFMESVGEFERVTSRFHIIKKKVQALAYSMRVNDMYNYIRINMDVIKNYFYGLYWYLLALSIGQRLCVNFYVSRANFLTTLRSHLNVTCYFYCGPIYLTWMMKACIPWTSKQLIQLLVN